ncbi:hypothetical protein Hanom_Chr04g00346111 [Helianthus anomalus]
MFIPNCMWCPLPLNLTSFVLNVSKSCTLCPLAPTQSDFFIKYDHVYVFLSFKIIGLLCREFYPGTILLNKKYKF